MAPTHISDLDEPGLELYTRLTDLQLRNRLEPEKGIFIAEGAKVIDVAIRNGYEPVSFLLEEKWLPTLETALATAEAREPAPPVYLATSALLREIAGYDVTRGALAAIRRKPLPTVDALLGSARRIAVLEGITNATNVGSIFRNAAGLGVDAILVDETCSDPLYRRSVRVSMGTALTIPWARYDNAHLFEDLRRHGYTSVALALDERAVDLAAVPFPSLERVALFLGCEGTGLAPTTLSNCDYVATIPMARGVDSLNVAAASAIAFYAAARPALPKA